jgi:hypothetical protein
MMINFQYNKKGATMTAFSWVFMIIVGGFMLLLAYNLIGKYIEIQDAKYEYELRNGLREAFSSVGQDEGIAENSLVPVSEIFMDKNVEITCEGSFLFLSVDGNLIDNDYIRSYPMYSNKISSSELSDNVFLAVETFKMPFKITNLVALVSKKNAIIFDKESIVAREIAKKFERSSYGNLNYAVEDLDTMSWSRIQDYGYDTVTVVSDRDISSISSIFSGYGADVNILIIKKNNKWGTLQYFDKNRNQVSEEFNYVDFTETMSIPTMAIFSSPQTFACSHEILENSIKDVYDYYSSKADFFINDIYDEGKAYCNVISGGEQVVVYDDLKEKLDSTIFEDNIFSNPGTLVQSLENLDLIFTNSEQYGCVYLY